MKTERKEYSVWVYGPRIGWWLVESGYDNFDDATADLAERVEHCTKMKSNDVTGGAVVIGRRFPVPMCDECLKAGRIHHPKTGKAKS